NRYASVPIVFHDNAVYHQYAVQIDGDVFSDHPDAEGIPFAYGIVSHRQRRAGMRLVVIQSARSYARIVMLAPGIPDLYLGTAAQVNTTVAVARNFPVHQHLEVAIRSHGTKVVALPREVNGAVFHGPVFLDLLIRFLLLTG